MRRNNGNKMKKVLMVLGLGFGLSLSSAPSSAGFDRGYVCKHLSILCASGNGIACRDYQRIC
jgi:hypothetical protein